MAIRAPDGANNEEGKWPILVGFYIGSSGTDATVNAGALFISTAVITAFTMLVSEVLHSRALFLVTN